MTVKDLLYKILEYNYLWASEYHINSKPAKMRLSQIEVLLEAFGLTKTYVNPLMLHLKYVRDNEKFERGQYLNKLTNLEYVIQGEFLTDRPKGANKELSEIALSKIKEIYPDLPDSIISRGPVDIRWMFNNLLIFRQEIYKIAYPNGGMSEGFSVGLYYSFYLQKRLKEMIIENIDEIDKTLCLILDPQKREFTNKEINYVEIDLEAIDREYMIENY
jgi:hypothetical protein